MKKISIINQKGGTCKTTLAINLAYYLSQKRRVVLIDSDPQRSARKWHSKSGGSILTVFDMNDAKTLQVDLKAIEKNYDVIIIDGPCGLTGLSSAIIRLSDLVLIPITPSNFDLDATVSAVQLVKYRQEENEGLPLARMVVSRAIKISRLSEEITDVLKELEMPILTSRTTMRMAYVNNLDEGHTVFHSKDQSAIEEISGIGKEVEQILWA